MAKVLIVDDAKFLRVMLSSILENGDFEVVAEAENGEEAIELYKEHRPDIVTMDITMPVMNGIDAIREIKKIDENASIVVCSAVGQKNVVVEAIEAGAKDFIVKPFNEKKVLETLNRILDRITL
ncbi:response regulator [Oceanobacillus sp. CAU 1775]